VAKIAGRIVRGGNCRQLVALGYAGLFCAGRIFL
jgi:hypothetical protein